MKTRQASRLISSYMYVEIDVLVFPTWGSIALFLAYRAPRNPPLVCLLILNFDCGVVALNCEEDDTMHTICIILYYMLLSVISNLQRTVTSGMRLSSTLNQRSDARWEIACCWGWSRLQVQDNPSSSSAVLIYLAAWANTTKSTAAAQIEEDETLQCTIFFLVPVGPTKLP
jgi:hypothetical protein